MENSWCVSMKDMDDTVVGVKRVKQEAHEDWDESMPLPGDIIEGLAEEDADESFVSPKWRSELNSYLAKINQQADAVWLKVRRGENTLKIRARIALEKSSLLHKRFTIKAAYDDRHVAVLGDLTLDQCIELQEMSRRLVNMESKSFGQKEVSYDWRMKVNADQYSSVVSSFLVMPLEGEYSIEASTARCMAWFSAAVSSGVPLVFVNIQTEQTVASKSHSKGKDSIAGSQQLYNSAFQILQGIRLWFLPGTAEIVLEMIPQLGEELFGIDVKRTDEGFICVYSVTKDSAADRAGVGDLYEQANKTGHLLVLSRLQGRNVMPSSINSSGFIRCCDQVEVKHTLNTAIEQMVSIQVHFIAWPGQTHTKTVGAASLRPPTAV